VRAAQQCRTVEIAGLIKNQAAVGTASVLAIAVEAMQNLLSDRPRAGGEQGHRKYGEHRSPSKRKSIALR
jgi:hypothetical protein